MATDAADAHRQLMRGGTLRFMGRRGAGRIGRRSLMDCPIPGIGKNNRYAGAGVEDINADKTGAKQDLITKCHADKYGLKSHYSPQVFSSGRP